jgi:hypothetical protein
MQKWINNYDYRMSINDVSGGRAVYQLNYAVDVLPEDRDLLMKLGLYLIYQPGVVEVPDAIFDFSEDRLNTFHYTTKHATQVCGAFCGEDGSPYKDKQGVKHLALFPELSKIQLSYDDKWLNVPVDDDVFVSLIKNNVYMGVIGKASWQTYAAAAMGLGVIEIVPEGRPKNWLTKWASAIYRAVEEGPDEQVQIDQARASIKEYLYVKRQEAHV